MRKVAYLLLIVLLIVSSLAVYGVVTTLRGVKSVTAPIGDLVQKLVVEATPVILPSPVMVVQEINSLARLETASYSFQDVLEIERNQDFLWGVFGEELLFVAYGEVIAGVDLAQMQPEDVQVVGPSSVVIHLPDSRVLLTRLDNDRSYVANRDIGFFTDADPQLETLIRQEAEARMYEAALAGGILEKADEQAKQFVQSFLQGLGFEDVTFVDSTPPPAPPYEQEVPKGFAVTPLPTAQPEGDAD